MKFKEISPLVNQVFLTILKVQIKCILGHKLKMLVVDYSY